MNFNTDTLLIRIRDGDRAASETLLSRYEPRLRKSISAHMDRRAAARFGTSDVLQDAMTVAFQRLPDYAATRPVPFFLWMRQIAFERLVDLHRKHVVARSRSVTREDTLTVSDEGLKQLADVLVDPREGPVDRLIRQELQSRVHKALKQLTNADQELIVMRYLEQLPVSEIGMVLGIAERAAKSRVRRALERLHEILQQLNSNDPS